MSQSPFDREFSPLAEKTYAGGPVYIEAMPTSQLAIVSLIFGILAYIMLPVAGALVAIIAGHVALGQIRDSGGRLEGGGMARTGLILGYLQVALVVLALVAIGCLLAVGVTMARAIV